MVCEVLCQVRLVPKVKEPRSYFETTFDISNRRNEVMGCIIPECLSKLQGLIYNTFMLLVVANLGVALESESETYQKI